MTLQEQVEEILGCGVEIHLGPEYDRVEIEHEGGVGFDELEKLSVLLGTKDIDILRGVHECGCASCGYGEKSTIEIRCRDCTKLKDLLAAEAALVREKLYNYADTTKFSISDSKGTAIREVTFGSGDTLGIKDFGNHS